MSNFFNEELHAATAQECKGRWSGGPPGENFRCYLCGYKFKEGDLFRAVYTNDITEACGNPLVCERCNAPTPILRDCWKLKHKQWNEMAEGSFWWFARKPA